MGFMNEPTAADYAWSAAQDAKEKNKALEARIATLEAGMADLMHVVYTFHIHAPERDKWGAWLLDYYGKKHEP